jgi:hypothetical protein
MRAVVSQVCRVCGRRTSGKDEMAEHVDTQHGVNWEPAQMTRSKDQMEFRPCSSSSRWGRELR